MTGLGIPDTAMDRGGTRASNSGSIANAYFDNWRADPHRLTADAYIQAHIEEIARSVGVSPGTNR